MNIHFLQTAELTYRELLETTSWTVSEYCARHQCSYESFFGVIRGYYPWQATYNRIPMLKRLVDAGHEGWVCYLDADAYIVDLDFDLRAYLADKGDFAFIAAPGTQRGWWDVNAGVFLINLSHPVGRALVNDWAAGFEAILEDQLRAAKIWGQTPDDQALLHKALKTVAEAQERTLIQRSPSRLLNYHDGLFIRQALRTTGDLESRVAHLRSEVAKLSANPSLTRPPSAPADIPKSQTTEAFVRALYRVLLLREPDPGGLASGVKQMAAGMSFEAAMRSCLSSEEFAAKRGQFFDVNIREKSEKKNLTILANKYGSDKGTLRGAPPHKYTYLYDLILDRYRNWPVNFLELGLAVGGPEVGGPIDRQIDSPSVQMWLEYLPRAHIYGFDISDFSHMKHPRFTFVRGDGGSAEDMGRLAKAASGFDIVVDDGSHASYHQQLAFKSLFPKLRPGGTYIIEDMQWQSPTYEGKPMALPKTRDFMIGFFEGGDYLKNELLSEAFMQEVRSSLASYAWFPAFNGVASPAKVLVLRKSE